LSPETNLSGRVALVTGSGRGLGKSIAETLAKLGADICLHDIREDAPAEYGEAETLTSVAVGFAGRGIRATAVTGDISDENEVGGMVDAAQSRLGPISILVNCAGGDIGARGGKPDPNDALRISLEDLRAVFDRNLFGTMLMCRAVCPGMAARRQGSVINIGSVAAHYGSSPEVAYACAKAAVLHFTPASRSRCDRSGFA
jgi:NAD(P)-dependent dehydrogenase (short-subunit alcohol dehydrogenase family)